MNKSLLKLLGTSLLSTCMLTSGQAFAEPTLYPTDITVLSSVKNDTNSNLLADAADPKTVWVMPPNTASAAVSGLHSKTANMGFCAEMRDLKDYSRELSAEIKDLMKKRIAKQEELSGLLKRADSLREEAEKFAAERNLSELAELDVRISSAESRLSDLYTASDSCTENCDLISQEIETVIKAKSEMMIMRNEMVRDNTQDQKDYNKKKKVADAALKAYQNQKNVYMELVQELTVVQTTFRDTFQSFGKMEGARAGIIYKSNWDENVQKLRSENPGFNFSKTATKNAQLMTELAGVGDIDPQGAVKSIAVGGEMKNGAVLYPAYPESLSSNVVLSLIGACPMEHPEYFDLTESEVTDMQYGVIITYEYDTVFTASATATYNMYKMYQKIVTGGSSGGFFSSRSWTNTEEKNFFEDSFIVSWNDPENTIPQEEKDIREQEMRRAVLFRLANLAIPLTPNRAEIVQAAQPGAHGAVVISDSLMKVCPTSIYCVGAAAVFNVLDAIFGSSSTSASYTSITDTQITEDYRNTQKITKSWITSYL